ncbi:MAG: riboflavin kinase/FMN adenylyltransferase [Cyclobacteriaceae bacterium]|jgi:riboflavin kinase/FMN adenylyltransferase
MRLLMKYKGMEIIDDINTFSAPSHAIVTSGTFDGVHVGHKKILKNIIQTAKEQSGQSVVITFWPHPRFVLKQNNDLKLITTFEEKAELLSELGIDFLVKIPFTKEFSQLSSDEFIKKVMVEGLQTRKLVIGYDHKFGKNREGSFDYLQKNSERYGFEIKEIPRQDIETIGVSSSKIRTALSNGDIHIANEFLGRMYAMSGIVKEGDRIGRSIGFPTANIEVPEHYKLIPTDGSYAVYVGWNGKEFKGMLNIGQRPTVSGQERRIEVNIFDFDKSIYNERLTIRFVKRLRDETKFENIQHLRDQLKKDKVKAMNILEG